MPAGDYGIALDDEIVAVVERKSVPDLTRRLLDGQLAYALAELATLRRAALVVEDCYADLLNNPRVRPGFIADQLPAASVRYPEVDIAFCDTRPSPRSGPTGSSRLPSPTCEPRNAIKTKTAGSEI